MGENGENACDEELMCCWLQDEEQDQFLFHMMTLIKKVLRIIDIPTLSTWTDIHKLLGMDLSGSTGGGGGGMVWLSGLGAIA